MTTLTKQTTTLNTIQHNEEWLIEEIVGEDAQVVRFYEMGFFPGSSVRLYSKSKLSSTVAVEIRGAKIALRQSDASLILVSRPDA